MSLNSAHDDKAATIASATLPDRRADDPDGGANPGALRRDCHEHDCRGGDEHRKDQRYQHHRRERGDDGPAAIGQPPAIPPLDPEGHQCRASRRDEDEHRHRQPGRFEQVEVDAVGVQEQRAADRRADERPSPAAPAARAARAAPRCTRRRRSRRAPVVIASRNTVADADLADLEAVVADAAANRVRRRDAQHPHRHPSTDAPDQEPGPRPRRGAEQHAAGGRHEAVAESPVFGLLDGDAGRATCR